MLNPIAPNGRPKVPVFDVEYDQATGRLSFAPVYPVPNPVIVRDDGMVFYPTVTPGGRIEAYVGGWSAYCISTG